MDIRKRFLQKDIGYAVEELRCVNDCLDQIIQHYKHDDFDKAKECTIDMLASLQTITNLAEDKQVYDMYQPELEGIPTFTEFRLVRMSRQ